MCDEETDAGLSRREFGGAVSAAAITAMVPTAACAATLSESEVTIKTPDGVADAHFVHPGDGSHPAVIVWPDIWGLRPAFRDMARRLAGEGYAVLTVNQFYRDTTAPIRFKGDNQRSPENWAMLRGFMEKLTADRVAADAQAFVTFLDGQKPVSGAHRMGVTGYCMGGPLVLRTAAAAPKRVGAGATFHSIPLVTDKPDSPHLLMQKDFNAALHIATSQDDDAQRPDEKKQLAVTMKAFGVKGDVEVYPAAHGWCPPGGPAHDPVQAERAWQRMLALFKAELG